MKYYECPNCGKERLCAKSRRWVCLDCKETFNFKQYSKIDLHHKKHLDKPSFITPDSDLVKKKAPIIKKSKQHCEYITQQALRTIPNIWYTKLQVNPNAHTPTVGDYLVLTQNENIILECKELNTTKNDRIPFSRLTQIGNMTAFEQSLQKNKAYFIILLWGQEKTIYIIPLKSMKAHIKVCLKKSMNIKELETNFENYKVPYENLKIYLKKLLD
jgi:hypothetical protein